MKAYSVVAHGIYALVVVALAAFIILGVVPTKTDGMPVEGELGVECVYEVTPDTEVMKYNFSDAVNSNGTDAKVYVDDSYVITVNQGNSASVSAAVTELQTEHMGKTAVLKDSAGEVLKQSMVLVEKAGVRMKMYTEVTLTNYLRYSLQDISVSVNQVSKDGTIKYLIAETPVFTVEPEETRSAGIDIEINYLNNAMIMLAGEKDTMKINMDINVAGKYMKGIAGADITVAASYAPSGAPTISVTENKIEAAGPVVAMIPVGTDVNAKIGGVSISVENTGSGFSAVVDGGTDKIIDALNEYYEGGDYTITYDIGEGEETVILTQEEMDLMIEAVSNIMETYKPEVP
ncbi:MAG: hypothetical protein ACOX8L_01420 [Candidatus Methanomethylophilaceae archaeon]